MKHSLKDMPKVQGKAQPAPHMSLTVGVIGNRVWLKSHPVNRPDLVHFYCEHSIEQMRLHIEACERSIIRIERGE